MACTGRVPTYSWEQAPHPYRFSDNQPHWGYRTRPPLQHLVITAWRNGLQEEITIDRRASRIENGKRSASQHEELRCMILFCDRMCDQRMACAPHTSSDLGKCNNPVCIDFPFITASIFYIIPITSARFNPIFCSRLPYPVVDYLQTIPTTSAAARHVKGTTFRAHELLQAHACSTLPNALQCVAWQARQSCERTLLGAAQCRTRHVVCEVIRQTRK